MRPGWIWKRENSASESVDYQTEMEEKLLKYYEVELQHIREMAGEFAREYPKIAGRLALDKEGKEICPDPFVERLLEGFAYLTSRIHVKLDAEFPRFTQSLLQTIYPTYLSPTPAMAVVQFHPDLKNKALAAGFTIARGTQIRSWSGRSEDTSCTYRTAHAVNLWPVEIREFSYIDRSVEALGLSGFPSPPAVFLLKLEAAEEFVLSQIPLDSLDFFIRGADSLPASILEMMLSAGSGILARSDGGKWQTLPKGSLSAVGHNPDHALLPDAPASFEGYRLLSEYFAFPQRFLFFEISGLRKVVAEGKGQSFEIAIPLNRRQPSLGAYVNSSLLSLHCTPVINLFEKRTDRINVDGNSTELHVVVDRTRPIDYEVFDVCRVTGYGCEAGSEQEFRPFYSARDLDKSAGSYFTVFRKQKLPTEKERRFGNLSTYAGSEVFLNLVDAESAPYSSEIEQLGVTALCTNRHLAIRASQGERTAPFLVEFNGPVVSAHCVTGPTAPRASFAMGETAWRIISQLSLNYFSLTDSPDQTGAESIREILRLYVAPNDRTMQKQIDGIRSITSSPILRRIPSPGRITFARGLEVVVLLDEEAYAGTGVFLIGIVLDQFFARHVTLNSFTETVIKTQQRGEIIRWPARTGRKPLL